MSDFFGYLGDVFSGRIKRWTRTNNVVVSQMWHHAENLPQPFDIVLKKFLVSAGLVVESLLRPGRKSKGILEVNLKSISRCQFERLYSVLLAYFCFWLYVVNSFLKEDLQKALGDNVMDPELAVDVLSSLESAGRLDMGYLSGVVWEKVVEVIGCGHKDFAGQIAYFGIMAGQAYVDAVKQIKSELAMPISIQ